MKAGLIFFLVGRRRPCLPCSCLRSCEIAKLALAARLHCLVIFAALQIKAPLAR